MKKHTGNVACIVLALCCAACSTTLRYPFIDDGSGLQHIEDSNLIVHDMWRWKSGSVNVSVRIEHIGGGRIIIEPEQIGWDLQGFVDYQDQCGHRQQSACSHNRPASRVIVGMVWDPQTNKAYPAEIESTQCICEGTFFKSNSFDHDHRSYLYAAMSDVYDRQVQDPYHPPSGKRTPEGTYIRSTRVVPCQPVLLQHATGKWVKPFTDWPFAADSGFRVRRPHEIRLISVDGREQIYRLQGTNERGTLDIRISSDGNYVWCKQGAMAAMIDISGFATAEQSRITTRPHIRCFSDVAVSESINGAGGNRTPVP